MDCFISISLFLLAVWGTDFLCGFGGWVVVFLGWYFLFSFWEGERGEGGFGKGAGLGGVGHSRVEQSRGKPAVTFPN